MTSQLAWLDFSERERRQALDVIDLFREDDTRDELGLGVIRDAFSDHYFPGTSTIQTRLRYFLFIPWIIKQLEDSHVSSNDIRRRSRNRQGGLRDSLIAGGEETGVIGYRAGINVQRLPSNVYWNGLRRWGILRFQGSEDEYQRSLGGYYAHQHRALHTDDGEPVDGVMVANWDPHLPKAPEDLFEESTFELENHEIEYITDRIKMTADRSLLSQLIDLGNGVDANTHFPWDHIDPDELDKSMKAAVGHGRNFSETMHGAALLYNLMLAEESGRDGLDEEYQELLGQWWDTLHEREFEYKNWDRKAFWKFLKSIDARVPVPTYQFVDQWECLIAQAERVEDVMASKVARQLIKMREAQLKGGRARIGNARAIELWNGAAGTAQLDYRWNRPVRSFLNDLLGYDEEDS